MTETTITKSIFLAAPQQTVWEYLTTKDKIDRWFNTADSDLVENEEFALMRTENDGSTTKLCWGTVLEMNAPNRLVYSFTVSPLNGAMTTVTWTLEGVPGGTKLSLVHEGIGDALGEQALGLLMALDKGWDAHFADLRSAAN